MKKIFAFVLLLFFVSGLTISTIPSLAYAGRHSTVPIPETNPEPPPPPEN